MAIQIVYEAKELTDDGEFQEVTRQFSTEEEEVKQIVPEDNKVGIHLKGQTVLVPFQRVHELRIDLDQETVQQLEEEAK